MTTTPTDRARTFSDQVADEIRAAYGRKRWSQARLAREMGVSPAWLNYRLTGTQEIGVNDLQRIAEVLGVRVMDLLPASARRGGAVSLNDHSDITPVRRIGHTPAHPFAQRADASTGPPSAVAANRRRPMPVRPPVQLISA